MIRNALIALGLSAGAASAQGMVQSGPIVDSCGGTRLVIEAVERPLGGADDLARASDVVSARIGGAFAAVFDYTQSVDAQIIVSLPDTTQTDLAAFDLLLERVDFGFHRMVQPVSASGAVALEADQIILPDAANDGAAYVVKALPFLDGGAIVASSVVQDLNGRPAVWFEFDAEGERVFSAHTAANIGTSLAIVLDGKVLSAPVILNAIYGGQGLITGNFTEIEVRDMAAVLQGGVLPFSLEIVEQYRVDGSNPSAAFCP